MSDINWPNTIEYSIKYKQQAPSSLLHKLEAHDVGLKGQNVLVVGSNNGKVAEQLAAKGCHITAIDSCEDYIDEAKIQNEKSSNQINYHCMPAEHIELENHSFDVILVHQASKHLDMETFLKECKRLLVPGGLVTITNVLHLPRLDIVAKKTDEIFLEYNSRWVGYDYNGKFPPLPKWSKGLLNLKGMFFYDEQIQYNKEHWVGRLKASSSLSGVLSKSKLIDFEKESLDMLQDIPEENLNILHRITAHIFQFK